MEENKHQYRIEFLNTLCSSGMRPHTLQRRMHSITMLLCNLDPVKGHCNGTRYVIKHLHDHIIDATIACGPRAGKQIFIPRIAKIPSDNIFPFQMKRKQFPVRRVFAITSKKAQGQSLSHEGIYLKQGFFSNGQLYVAMSRVCSTKTALKSIPTLGYIPAMWFTKKSCVSEQGEPYYNIIILFVERVLY